MSDTSPCATALASSWVCARSSSAVGFGAFTTNFEDLGGLRQLPGLAVQRLMADGYGFGGEGDWKTAVLLRTMKTMADGLPGGTSLHGGLHLPPRPRRGADPRRAHARGLSDDHLRPDPAWRSTRSPSAAARTPSGSASSQTLAQGSSAGMSDLGDRFRITLNEIEVVDPDHDLPRLPVACAVWKPRPSLETSAESWLMAGAPHHTVLTKALPRGAMEDLATITGVELVVIDAETTIASVTRELRWNAAYHRLAARL